MSKIIYIAGGCFWGIEKYFQMVRGITFTECGYANGNIENPKYEELKKGIATHAEVVKLEYDDGKISLNNILEHFFELVNPFTLNEQGIDKGIQYRSGIYCINDEDFKEAKAFFEHMQTFFEEKIVVSVEPLQNYYRAEEYHQDYYNKNPECLESCPLFKKS